MTRFTVPRRIRFSDCDPAGIVFFPQYFIMLNGLVEDWVTQALGIPYHGLITTRGVGLPTVRLESEFRAVSRLGDDVLLRLGVERLGHRSLTLHVDCVSAVDEELRMTIRQVIVTTSLATHRAIAMPEDLRQAIEVFMGEGG